MIDHERALELAASALDFELSSADRNELRLHLATCESCRASSDAIYADARSIVAMPSQDAPDHLRRRITGLGSEVDGAATDRGTIEPGPRVARPFPFRDRRVVAVLASAAIVVVLIGGTMVWRSTRSDDHDVAATSPSPALPNASGGAPPTASGGPPGASPAPGSSAPVTAGVWTAVATLTSDGPANGLLGLDSTFRLTSLDATPAADLAKDLRVDPPIALAVTPEPDGTGVRLTPSRPLTPGTVYRFTLVAPDGRTLDSWAFQAEQPLSVVSTLPEDRETDVPLDTGIEVTFDQDGVTDAASHMTVSPKTSGHFEQHGRVLVFVPDRLKPRTVYTVTVAKGVSTAPGGTPMERDVRFEFETTNPGTTYEPSGFSFADDLYESATSSRPVISLWVDEDSHGRSPDSVKIDVYRLDGLDAAIGAFRHIRADPGWSRWSTTHLVPTGDLPKVLSVDARLRGDQDVGRAHWFTLPEPLPPGWYVVEQPSKTQPIQAVLQVTDVASYLVVSDTKTLVWANDLSSGGPIEGATVRSGGVVLGQTGPDGVVAAAMPAGPVVAEDCGEACIGVVTVSTDDGRSAFLPTSGDRDSVDVASSYGTDSRYWMSFHTDRVVYRQTDTVNFWGLLRDRDSGKVPAGLRVRLLSSSDGDMTGPAVGSVDVVPHATGAFTGSVPIKDLPYGSYDVELLAGDEIVGGGAFEVQRILKPAYRLEIETGHLAYVAGERIKTTVRATFYEGSPVPGVLLRVENGVENGVDKRVTTDATGTAVARTVAASSYVYPDGSPDYQEFIATPRRAEEGQIEGVARGILVYPSNWMITSASEVSGSRIRVSGTVDALDRDGLERDLEAGVSPWEVDARGDPVSGARVTATFYEVIPTKTRTGTTYDFIEKKTVPVYEYGTRERRAGTMTFTTDARGRFSVSIPDSGGGHDYRIALRTRDTDGLVTRGETEASASYAPADGAEAPVAWLGPTEAGTGDYDVGDRIDLTMFDLTHPSDDHSRYLFQVAQRGLRDWTVESSPRFGSTFDATDVPDVTILGVRFTGTGYIVADPYVASFRSQLRHVDVGLTVDKARFGPRDTVDVSIRTRDADGKPIAATVVLRAIDEKLFSIGAAEEIDPLSELYEPVGSGISSTYVSHRSVTTRGEGGDTGGGGDDRNVFRDSLLFKAVDTDSAGTASVSFRLSDDLTSWRVLGSAYTGDLRAGEGTVVAAVGLPFFVDASVAPEYLLADRPTIMLRAFGTALTAHSKVTFSVTSDSLGLRTGPMVSTAFADQPLRLPRLTLGTHSLTITARSGTGSSARTDRLTRTFLVVRSRLTTARTAYVEPSGPTPVDGGDELTEVVVSDASAGRHVPLLVDIADGGGVRLERALAADLAAQLLVDRFGAPGSSSSRTFDGTRYQNDDGGVGLVPAGGSDLERSALVAIVAPDRFDRAGLMDYLVTIRSSAKATRERRIYALAGLAGLGAPVLPSIREAATDQDLTIRERLMLGLGAAALGDAATARSIEATVFAAYGEETPVSARIRVGSSAADSSAGTALMAILAADIGDPRAPAFWAYVEANPTSAAVHDLHAIAYVEGLLRWMPVAPASFAYTVGGKRTVVDLPAGGTFTMNVTPAQLRELRVETIAGAVGVTTRWREPVKASAIKKDREITVRRSIRPAGIRASDLVIVDLSVHFGSQAPLGCHEVTELVPSGLVVVGGLEGTDYADEYVPEDIASPYAAAAQRLSFCAENTKQHRTAHLRYVARVITPGTYTWEPTIVGSRTAPGAAGLTPVRIVTIR